MSGLWFPDAELRTETQGTSALASLDHHGPHWTLGSSGGGAGKKLLDIGVVKSARGLVGADAPGAGALVDFAAAWSNLRSRKAAKLG